MPCSGQTVQTGKAETSGFCSPAVSGSNNQFTITCQNIPDKLRAQLVDLLNRVAKNQSDATTILGKLDGCLEGIKQVREDAAPWHMTDDQKKELKVHLANTKAKFEIHALGPDKNALLFGIDLMLALEDSGWHNAEPSSTVISDWTVNPQLVGVVVVTTHLDFPDAALLQSALNKTLRLNIPGERDDAKKIAKADDVVAIVVGAKPRTDSATHY
jgi:hypothetical protein